MRKPSIFSKEYERRRKRKRKRIVFLVLLLLAGSFSLLYFTPVSRLITNSELYKGLQAKYKDNGQKDIINKEEGNNEDKEDKKGEVEVPQEEYFEVMLPNSITGRAVYQVEKGESTFKEFIGDSLTVFDISPSGKKMIVLDGATQNLLEISIDNTVKNLTYEYYTTTKNAKVYKDKTLQNNPDYLWHSTPRYISEDKVAYISNLPWINKVSEQYVWVVDTLASSHSYIKKLKGKEITFGTLTAEGLEVTSDGALQILSPNGQVLNK